MAGVKPPTSRIARIALVSALASTVVPLAFATAAGARPKAAHVTATATAPSLVACRFSVLMSATPGYSLHGSTGRLYSLPPNQATCQVQTAAGVQTASGPIGFNGTYGVGLASLAGGGTCVLDTGNGSIRLTLTVEGDPIVFTGSYQRLGLLLGDLLIGSLGSQAFVALDSISTTSGNCLSSTETSFTDSGNMTFEPAGAPQLLP